MDHPIVFLDDGGVMNDNAVRTSQWQQFIGAFFPPRLGGTPAAWAEAHRVVSARLVLPEIWHGLVAGASGYQAVERAYRLVWLGDMCRRVGVPVPPERQALALAAEATTYVTTRVRSAYPGAVAAIRALNARGYALHTASGESSVDLTGYLDGMGVRACFGRLYGPDLIDTFKGTMAYYERIFADVGVAAEAAVVVDDLPQVLALAARLGARTVLVGPDQPTGIGITAHIRSIAALPALLAARQGIA